MTLSIVLYGLRCSMCGEEDQLWQDVVRGLIECRACGARAMTGEDVGDDFDGTDLDGAGFEVEMFDELDLDGEDFEIGGLLDR